MKRLLLLILALFLATPAWSATYYVSKVGSDGHSCSTTDSAGTNKLTIGGGVGCLSSGDTLVVHAGTYVEALTSGVPSGTSSFPTTIQNAASEVVWMAPTSGLNVILLSGKNYVTVNGILLNAVGQSTAGSALKIDTSSTHVRYINGEITNCGNCVLMASNPGGGTNEVSTSRLHDAAGYGIYDGESSSIINGNTIYNTDGYGIHLINNCADIIDGDIVSSNIIHDYGRTGSAAGIVSSCFRNMQFYNNVIYNGAGAGIALGGNSGNGNSVDNNVVYGATGSFGAGVQLGVSMSSVTQLNVRNNIFYSNAQAGVGGVLDSSSSTWTALTNWTTNPSFVNAASGDFRLAPGSPAINAGVTLAAFSTDIGGVPRPQGPAWDIGAYESAGTGITYFISPASPPVGSPCSAGNDSQDGRAASTPFRTVQAFSNVSAAGDTALLCPGNFGGFTITASSHSGSAGAPIRLTSYSQLTQATLDPQYGYVQDVVHHNPSSTDSTTYDFILVSGNLHYWTFDYLKFNNSSSTLASILGLSYGPSDTANRAALVAAVDDAGLWGGLMTIQQTSLTFSDHLVFDHLTIERMGFLGGNTNYVTFSNNTVNGHGYGVDGTYFDYYVGTNQDFHDNTYTDFNTFIHHFNGCNCDPMDAACIAVEHTDGNFYRESYSNTGNWTWQGLDGSWNITDSVLYICHITNGGTVNVFDSTFYNNAYGYGASAYSGGGLIRLNGAAYGSVPHANIVNNTFHRVRCDSWMFVYAPSSFSNNLTISHEQSKQSSDTGSDCYDGDTAVTKQTNILSGSTSLLIAGDSSNLHLASTAGTAIDAGTNLSSTVPAAVTDRDGLTRPYGLGWDIGAYEFNSTPSAGQLITFVQANDCDSSVDNTSLTCAFDSNTTTGNAIVACAIWKGDVTISTKSISSGVASFTDSGAGRLARPTDGYLQCQGATSITGGTTPTVTFAMSGTTTEYGMVVAEYSGVSITDMWDVSATGTASSGLTVTTGSLTPTTNNGAVIVLAYANATGATTPGYTARLATYFDFSDYIFSTNQGTFTVTSNWDSTLTKGGVIAAVMNAQALATPVFNSIFFPPMVRGIAP